MPAAQSQIFLLKLFFLLQPVAFGSWLPCIPEVQRVLGLDARSLAFALAGMPAGILLTLPFAAPAVHATGPRRMLMIMFPMFLISAVLPVWAQSQFGLFLSLLLLGCALSTTELAMNVEADSLEKQHKVSIMNACHGFWSLGMMTGSLLGATQSEFAIAPGWGVALTATAVLIPGWVTAYGLPTAQQATTTSVSPNAASWWPSSSLLGIAVFVFGVTLTEGAIADWSAVFLHDVHGANGLSAGFGYSAFAGLMTMMRLNGDALKRRYSSVSLARACGGIAVLGTVLVVTSINAVTATVGFALLGIGAAVAFPLAVSSGGQLTDRPVAASVAFISFVALVGFLVGPVVIGTMAQAFGMRIGLSMVLPALIISLMLAHNLNRRTMVLK